MKKGQVTIFIIAGIVILLMAGLFIYLQSQIRVVPPPKLLAPPEIESIQKYVEDCLRETATEGIEILGENGGYIYWPEQLNNVPISSIWDNQLKQPKTALWRNRGVVRYPTEEYMIADIERYINENLDECTQGLEPFSTTFEISKMEMSTTVKLAEEGIDVSLNYPLEIIVKGKNQTITWNEFSTFIPLRLKAVYDLARQIIEEEVKAGFIEEIELDLLALDNEIPYQGSDMSCSPHIWYTNQVREKFKLLLSTNLPLVRINKTSYSPVPEGADYEQNHFVYPLTERNYPNTHVSFSFDESYPLQMNIQPNTGGQLLKSGVQRGSGLMGFLCVNAWHFTYDIRHPVLVTIVDDSTASHDKYVFNFGFESGINHNQYDSTDFGTYKFDIPFSADSSEYCKSRGNIITVNTFENISAEGMDIIEELPKVNITFSCIRYGCEMGYSDWQFRGAVVWLQKEFPYCINGIIRATKEGYAEQSAVITTDKEKSVELYLNPITKKKLKVVNHFLTTGEISEMEEDEFAIVTVLRDNLKSEAFYPYEEELVSELTLLDKADFDYNITAYVVNDFGMIGGFEGSFRIAKDELDNGDTIVVHVVEWPFVNAEVDPYAFAEYLTKLKEYSSLLPGPQII